MASLKLFGLAILCVLSVVVGQNTLQPGNGDLSIETGYVWADVLTDGRTWITFGDITADTLTLTARLTAGDSTVANLAATSLAVANLKASSLDGGSVQTSRLDVWNPALFESDVTISGNLHAGPSYLSASRTTTLEVQGQANIRGSVFAQQDVIVGHDLNVGGAGRFFGPAAANGSLFAEEMLQVGGSAWAANWAVLGYTQTQNLEANDTKTLNLWAQTLNVTGNINITGDVQAKGGLSAGKQVLAKSLNTALTVTVGANATVGGGLTGKSATVTGNATVGGWEQIRGSLTVQGSTSTQSNYTTGTSLNVVGNISSQSVLAPDSIFNNLNVDTSTIQTLTSTFVTATTLHATDATATNSFVGQGDSTLASLNVVGASSFNTVKLVSLVTDDLSAQTTTLNNVNSTSSAVLTTAAVTSVLSVGSNEAHGYTASFQTAFADNLTAVLFWGAQANVTTLSGKSLNYKNISGVSATLTDFQSTNAKFDVAQVVDAHISTLTGTWSTFTHITATSVDTMTLSSVDGDLEDLYSRDIQTDNLWTPTGTINSTTAGTITTDNFKASNYGYSVELRSTAATVTDLKATNATITDLVSAKATTTSLWGDSLHYNTGTITAITSENHLTTTAQLNGFDAQILYANVYANISSSTVQKLKVTESSWITQDVNVIQNLQVAGFSTIQQGIIAGDSVIAALTVVGDTLTSIVSVTGPAWLTDLSVKKMTITDQFSSTSSHISNTTALSVDTSSNFTVGGFFNVQGDSRLGGNLVVQGTTQFQTGSFSRIGTAILTTTDMEAFNINVASGLFGGLVLDDLTVNRAATFDRTIALVGMLGSTSGAPYSVYSSILPSDLTGTQNGLPITIQAATVLHTGQSTVDALVFTSSTDPTVAKLRVTGDGYLDFLGGTLQFEALMIEDGIVFENENNAAWARDDAIPTLNLAQGASGPFYVYNDLTDRDGNLPGVLYDPTRFAQPSLATDLITLSAGHYRVSGSVNFVLNGPATASSRILARAGVNGYAGTQSSAVSVWQTDCIANFQTISGSSFGGSCFFEAIVTVDQGAVATLRTFAEWSFSSVSVLNTLRVDPISTILVEEYFVRTSEVQ